MTGTKPYLGASLKLSTYLTALAERAPTEGRPRNPETIKKRIAKAKADLDSTPAAKPMTKVLIIQRIHDLEAQIEAVSDPRFDEKEAGFVEVARGYSLAKGIGYSTWREVGVSAEVLKRAGISRNS